MSARVDAAQMDNDAELRECFTKLQASVDYNDEYDFEAEFKLLRDSFLPLTAQEKAGGPMPNNPANAKLCSALKPSSPRRRRLRRIP